MKREQELDMRAHERLAQIRMKTPHAKWKHRLGCLKNEKIETVFDEK